MKAATSSNRSAQRAALSNGVLVRYSFSVLLNVVAEWATALGVLVYAFDRSGTTATGFAATALIIPYLLFSPIAGALAERYRPQHVRFGAMALQVMAFGVAALAAFADEHIALVVIPAMIAAGGATILGPAGAVLRPAIVRSSLELTIANLWSGYAKSISVLAAPVLATLMLAIGGAPSVLGAAAVIAAISLAVSAYRHPPTPPGGSDSAERVGALRLMKRELLAVRRRKGVLAVLIIAGAQYFLVGALDIIVVVAAQDEFGLGPAGAGTLATAVGLGAFMSSVVSTTLVRRRRLAPAIGAAMLAITLMAVVLGIALMAVVAFAVLPVMGLARSTHDVLSQVLLQRSAEPEALGSVFAVLELARGSALLVGTAATQFLIAVGGVRAALFGTAAYFLILFAATAIVLRAADESADVPVVAMSLLRRVPIFEPLPRAALEAVARTAVEVDVRSGEAVIAQGEPGDRFYVVAQGEFEVLVDGRVVERCTRCASFGELALLADVPRAASVRATTPGSLLAIERSPFLVAVTGHDSARQAAWGVMQRLQRDGGAIRGPHQFAQPPAAPADSG